MPELVPAVPLTPAWHAARRGGVTATDIVTILGLSSWDSQYSLFWRKMGQVPEVGDNDRFRLGRELESYVVRRFKEECPAGLFPHWPATLFRSSVRTWQMATPDRILIDSDDDGGQFVAVFKGKTWADTDRHSWGAECGDQGQPCDHVPPRVRAQVLWQMDVMDVAVGHVGVVFLPSGEFRSYTIEHERVILKRDMCSHLCDYCTDLDLMRAAGEEFMARLRLELPPPDPDSSAATLAAVRARFSRQPAKQAEIDEATFGHWRDAKEEADAWAREVRGWEIKIREQAGEASELTVDGQPVARRIIVDAQVKAHTRHQDYLKRIKQGDDSE